MKKLITILFFMLVTTLSFAQGNYQDVVYLKNGSIIKGVIVEQVPNKSIKIETSGGSVFVYTMDEIEKLTREQLKEESVVSSNLPKGSIELGYQIGSGDYKFDRLKLNFISSYEVSPQFLMGYGLGFRFYFDQDVALMPFLADFKYNFEGASVTPFLALSMGYSFDITNEFEGAGFLLNPRFGVNFNTSGKSKLGVSVGYEMQRMDVYDYYWDEISTENLGAIGLTLSLSF